MNSKDLGADLYLAWTRAELGIMGAEQAVGVVHRRALAVAADPPEERRRLAEEYSVEHLSAASRGPRRRRRRGHPARRDARPPRVGALDDDARPPAGADASRRPVTHARLRVDAS